MYVEGEDLARIGEHEVYRKIASCIVRLNDVSLSVHGKPYSELLEGATEDDALAALKAACGPA